MAGHRSFSSDGFEAGWVAVDGEHGVDELSRKAQRQRCRHALAELGRLR